jgi:hypothetical protein
MAGKIIADIIEAPAGRISLNVGNTVVASINASGLYTSTGNLLITQAGTVEQAALFSGFKNGITEADQWRLTTTKTSITSSTIVDANWERVDTYGFDKIGTGMSESSGVFTFPSTGYWLVLCQIYYRATGGTNAFIEAYLQTTTNNSTYDNISTIIDGGQASNDYGGLYGSFIFDVTSTTTHKCRLSVAAQVSCQINGNTNSSFTSLTFIRLGDT